MDFLRFDAFARSLKQVQDRRGAARRGLALVAALGSGLALPSAAAGKKKRKKKKKVTCPPIPPPTPEPTCSETCHGACDLCFIRAAGPLLCGSLGGGTQCSTPCFSDNDCVGSNRPYCVTHIEDRETGVRNQACPDPGGWCFGIFACG